MPDRPSAAGLLPDLLADIERSIGSGALDEALELSRTLNQRLRAHCVDPGDGRDLLDGTTRIQLLLGRTATLRSELMVQLRDARRKRQAIHAYQSI